MTTWVNSQFPRPDFHRQVQRHYGLQNPVRPSDVLPLFPWSSSMTRIRSLGHPRAAARSTRAYCRCRDSMWLRTCWGSDWRMKTIANRLKCQSLSGDGRKPRPAAILLAIVPSPGVATGKALGLSVVFIACLLANWRQCELLGHDPTEGAQDSLSRFDGQHRPELAWNQETGSTDRARGGTVVCRDRRMITLLVDPSGGGRGTTRPTGEVPND